MANFKVNEYFKDYVAVQKEYLSDLKQLSEPIEVPGKLTSVVLLNGQGYTKVEYVNNEDKAETMFMPNFDFQSLPVIEFTATKNNIHIEIYKIIDKRLLEHTTYISTFENEDDIVAKLETKHFDVSDEVDNVRYIFEYGMLLDLGKKIDKDLVGSKSILAKRDNKKTIYSQSHHGYFIEPIIITNKNTSLFEMMMHLSKQMQQTNKTK